MKKKSLIVLFIIFLNKVRLQADFEYSRRMKAGEQYPCLLAVGQYNSLSRVQLFLIRG